MRVNPGRSKRMCSLPKTANQACVLDNSAMMPEPLLALDTFRALRASVPCHFKYRRQS